MDVSRQPRPPPQVKQWVRNLDQALFGFWLPTARGRFFPDFIAELVDGRIAIIEYKGGHLRNDPYEIEKRKVGELWAANSQRCGLFPAYQEKMPRLSRSSNTSAAICSPLMALGKPT